MRITQVAAGLCGVLLLVGIMVGCAPGKPEPTSPAETQQETKVEPYQLQLEPEKEQVQEEEGAFIPGLASADIKVNLQNLGFKFTGPRAVQGTGMFLDDGKLTDPDTGVELSCTITLKTPFRIKSVTFRADGTAAAGIISSDTYLSAAKAFLGYSATLPFEGAEPEKARKWVEMNIKQANVSGKPIVTVIGSVEYTLAGGKYMRLLSIQPAPEKQQ